MPEFSSYPPGTPSWVDLSTSDVNGAARFYGELLGWETAEDGGGHRTFTLRGKPVAGLARVHEEDELPAWLTYIASDDVDATARRAGDAGGQVVMPPFDVADAGRSTVLADATGAVFAVWQAGRRSGAELANEPSTLCWTELATRDVDAAARFYREVFGWGAQTRDMGGGVEYTELQLDGRTVAGMSDMADRFPDEVPAHWGVCFAVEDCDAGVDRAKELGGSVAAAAMTIDPGRFAVLVDPQGATFSIIALSG
jgi:predicted enzyme related to lactoylglutathione lyase